MVDVTAEIANAFLSYDPETGKLFWKERAREHFYSKCLYISWNKRCAGKEAFACTDTLGYKTGYLTGKRIRAHRVIWLMVTGGWPSGVIDHIDRDRANNRLDNLRDVTQSVNLLNSRLRKDNTSGVTGVRRATCGKKWAVTTYFDGVKHQGVFESLEEAKALRQALYEQYFREKGLQLS